MATNKEISDAEKEFKGDTDNNKKTDTTKPIRDEKGNIIANPPDPTKQEIERKTKEVKDQSRKTRGSKEPLIRQTEYTSDTRRASEDPVSYGKGDGRKAGRTKQERKTGQVTYQTFVNKPEVTGGQDRATDTRSSVYIPKPEEIEKIKPKPETKPETKRERNKRVRTAADQIISDIRTGKDKKVKTKTQSDDVPPPIPPKPTAVGASGDSGDTPQAFSSIKKFAKKNPQIAAAGTLAGYDIGKGILSKIMNLRGPAIQGGKAGFRSAGR